MDILLLILVIVFLAVAAFVPSGFRFRTLCAGALAFLVLFLLGGCVTMDYLAAQCSQAGFHPGTPAHAECVKGLAQAHILAGGAVL